LIIINCRGARSEQNVFSGAGAKKLGPLDLFSIEYLLQFRTLFRSLFYEPGVL